MTENATFKVKTADERKAEFDAYNVTQNKLEEEYRAKAYTIARDIEAFMDKKPNATQWLYSIYKGHEPKAISYVQNPKVVFHLESLYKKAGFNISTVFEEELGLCLIKISRK